MSDEMREEQKLQVQEVVVLDKFKGNSTAAKDLIERIKVVNGLVAAHDKFENGEEVGPVENSELLGKDIGYLTQPDKEVE